MRNITQALSDVNTKDKPSICMKNHDNRVDDFKEIIDRDLSRYNPEDVKKVFDTLDEKFNEYNHFDSYVSIYSEEAHLFVEEYAKRNDMNIFLYVHSSSYYYDYSSMIYRLNKFIEKNKGKDFIFYLNCNDHSELFDTYGNRSPSNMMMNSAYKHIISNFIHYINGDVKCVFVLDSKYHKRTRSYRFIYNGKIEEWDTASTNLTKIYNQSDKLIVRKNNELINKM